MSAPDPKPSRRVKDPGVFKRMYARGGTCALANDTCTYRLELHHLLPRSQGGDDVEANLYWLCSRHHTQTTYRDTETLAALRAVLRSDTTEYLSDKIGSPEKAEAWLQAYL